MGIRDEPSGWVDEMQKGAYARTANALQRETPEREKRGVETLYLCKELHGGSDLVMLCSCTVRCICVCVLQCVI